MASLPSKALAAYLRALDSHPLSTQMAASAALWSAGDVVAQHLEQGAPRRWLWGDSQTTTEGNAVLDRRRLLAQTAYSAVVWAPAAHYWYEALDKVVRKVARVGTIKFVGAKLALEMVTLHPLSLVAFFATVGLINGERPAQIFAQLRRDLAPTLALEWALWAPLDIANFKFVPVRHQLLVTNCGCLVESVGLSLVKSNGICVPGSH
ncbi:hypothetical protein AB1Y20_002340 [Prymnesium parvum]|uniref:Peroxisomal membrane protein PEX16 n=1 Tax=Prymnesium parvum TaxID=97485 RepID=A0AB34JB05_PRYPA